MTQVKTSIGFEAEIDESALNDMAFLDALAELEDGKSYRVATIADLILGKDNKKRLYDMLKDAKGRVPAEAAMNQVSEILMQLQPAKN